MRAAELTWVAGYVVTDSAGITQTVSLTQTAVYRRGRNNWLLAPPEPAFWQGSDEFRGDYLEAIYPGRDEAIAMRLARGLDATLAAICRGGCPAGFRLRLILSPDPASFPIRRRARRRRAHPRLSRRSSACRRTTTPMLPWSAATPC